MRKIIIYSAIMIFSLILSCNNNQSDEHYFNPENIIGIYRLSSGGGYQVILNIRDTANIDYLMWVDIGGYFFGRKGIYKINNDTLFLSLYYPVSNDTHYVRYDTLLIKKWFNKKIFKPLFVNDDWYVKTDSKTNEVIRGHDCFAKVDKSFDTFYDSIKISNWDTLKNKNSFPKKLPHPLRPYYLDSLNVQIDYNEMFENKYD